MSNPKDEDNRAESVGNIVLPFHFSATIHNALKGAVGFCEGTVWRLKPITRGAVVRMELFFEKSALFIRAILLRLH